MSEPVADRLTSAARAWGVTIDEWFETGSSVIAYGQRRGDDVVLKLVSHAKDEWRAGAIAAAFAGRGCVRVLEQTGGAMLLERVRPGRGLVDLSRSGRDADATAILAGVIAAMVPDEAPSWCPTVTDWGRGFTWYRETGDRSIPDDLVARAAEQYAALAASQRSTRLLHGDLHHYNIVEDHERGWLAIDPKGVIGETEYEAGAMLRNPVECPDVFASAATIRRRIDIVVSRLGLDADRVLLWAYAQAVLSAIWHVEDGHAVGPDTGALVLTRAIEPMIF